MNFESLGQDLKSVREKLGQADIFTCVHKGVNRDKMRNSLIEKNIASKL